MMSPAAKKVPTNSTPSTIKNLYFRQHMTFYNYSEFFSNVFAQSRIRRQLPFISEALSFMSSRTSLFPMSFLTPKLSSPLSSLTAFWASLTLSTQASLYFSQTAVRSLLRPLILRQLSSSLGCLSWMMECNFCKRPYANLSGQSSLTQAADRSVSVVLTTYQFPNSPFSLSRSPTLAFRNLALLAINFPSSVRPFLVLGTTQTKRKEELLQCARRTAVRLIFKIIENLWMYNVICKLEALMDHNPNHNNNNPHPRRPTFLSEYESHESESHSGRGRHIRSGRIMRKLKQLWLRQRYLTDDEVESGREGCFDTERQSGQGLWEKPVGRPSAEGGEEKRFRPRQVSSQEEQLNIIRKKSNQHSAQSQEPSKQSRDMEQLEQIAAFNSQVQNESK